MVSIGVTCLDPVVGKNCWLLPEGLTMVKGIITFPYILSSTLAGPQNLVPTTGVERGDLVIAVIDSVNVCVHPVFESSIALIPSNMSLRTRRINRQRLQARRQNRH